MPRLALNAFTHSLTHSIKQSTYPANAYFRSNSVNFRPSPRLSACAWAPFESQRTVNAQTCYLNWPSFDEKLT